MPRIEQQWTLVAVFLVDGKPVTAVKHVKRRVTRQEAVDMTVHQLGLRSNLHEIVAIPGIHTFVYHRQAPEGWRKRPGPGRHIPS